MAVVPTYQSPRDVSTGAVAPRISFAGPESQAASGRSISQGLNSVSNGLMDAGQAIGAREAKMKQRQEYDDHLWSEGKLTEAQRKWIQWSQDVQKNGSEDVVEQFNTQFKQYREDALKQAPTKGARDRLQMKLDDLGTNVFESSLRIEAVNKSKNTINTMQTMMSDSSDIIAQAPELYAVQQQRLAETVKISAEQGRISPEVAAKMLEHVDSLAADAAEAMIPKDPERAREILKDAKGIQWSRRHAITGEIDRAVESNTTLFHYQQQEVFKSAVESIAETGESPQGFNVDQYVASFPKKQQEAAALEAHQRLEVSYNIYSAKSDMQGQGGAEIAKVLEKFAPKTGSENFASQSEAYQHILRIADRQMKLQTEDPFTYARQDPIVDGAWKLVEGLPQDATPEMRMQLTSQAMDASVNFQRHLGVAEGKLSVMSNAQAVNFATKINEGDVSQVQNTFMQMQANFGKYYPNAFRDLARLPDGKRIDGAMQIVALHLGEPFLADFIQSVRTKESDMNVEPVDKKMLNERLRSDANFAAFGSAMLAANPGAMSYVDDFRTAIDKYAMSLLSRGKVKSPDEAIDQATQRVITSAYMFTELNGSSIAVKRAQGAERLDEGAIPAIKSELRLATEALKFSDIDTSRFGFPPGLSDEIKKGSITDTLQTDTFWSTNAQNDGVTLYMNGVDGTTAPVKHKDGRPIQMKFTDMVAAHNAKYPQMLDKLTRNQIDTQGYTGY